jgi:lipoprotein LprG
MSLRRTALPLLVLAVLLGALTACTGGGGGKQESASALLARAKTSLDKTKSAHFVLTSAGAPTSGTALIGGEGDIARPSGFQGTLKVRAAGSAVDLKVISTNGTVYAQLPFTASYSTVDPAAFGFGDPGKLLDPGSGVSQLLAKAQNAKLGAEKRVSGEVVREVSAQIPGDLVQQVLTSDDPSKPVQGRFSIASDSGQLRRAVLTGPFFSADDNATFTLDLSKFGEDVTITAPPTG